MDTCHQQYYFLCNVYQLAYYIFSFTEFNRNYNMNSVSRQMLNNPVLEAYETLYAKDFESHLLPLLFLISQHQQIPSMLMTQCMQVNDITFTCYDKGLIYPQTRKYFLYRVHTDSFITSNFNEITLHSMRLRDSIILSENSRD